MKISKILFLISLFSLVVSGLYAGLSVNPTRAEVTLTKGEAYGSAYNVRNGYNVPVDVRVETKDWFVLPENKKRGIVVSKWLSVSTPTVHLNPGEGADVQYKVVVPKKAQGSMVAMISFVSASPGIEGINLAISVPVYVTVSGTEKIDWQIQEPKFLLSGKKLQVSCPVKNSGNVYIRPAGLIEIISGDKVVMTLHFIEGRPVYPGSDRAYGATSESEIKPGSYRAVINISCAGKSKQLEKEIGINETGEITVK